jgi:hypothetical protein
VDYRQRVLSGYERQLIEERIPRSGRVYLGEDSLTTWESSRVHFLAEFQDPLVPTHGQALGARGELIEWDRPATVIKSTEWVLRDYDVELLDQFYAWHYASTALRAFVWGRFWLRCRIRKTTTVAPYRKTHRLTLSCRGLYVYKPNLPNPIWDDTAIHRTYNNPFYDESGDGFMYGKDD